MSGTEQEQVDQFVVNIDKGMYDKYLQQMGRAIHERHVVLTSGSAIPAGTGYRVVMPLSESQVPHFDEKELISYGPNKYQRIAFVGQQFVVPGGGINTWCNKHAGEVVKITGARTKFMLTTNVGTPQEEERVYRPFGTFPFLFGEK